MRLLYVTVSMPFGPGEAFFIPEVKEILRQGHEMLIVQRSPAGDVMNRDADGLQNISLRRPLLSAEIAAAAILEFFSRPRASLGALALFFGSRNLSTLLKNLVVFPKALWLGRVARRWKADHIHAQWGATTATMAMIASRVSGVPWSFTFHRGDIVQNNLLPAKTAGAAFVRFISESGREMAESLCGGPCRTKAVVLHLGVELLGSPRACFDFRVKGGSPGVKGDSPIFADTKIGTIPSPRPSGTGAEDRTILCPANLLPVKGHQYLLHAIAVLKQRDVECRLDVAGEGCLRGRLEALARRLSIDDRVRFLGQVPHERLLAMLQERRAGLVVLPSVDLGEGLHEGIPVALIEAMSLGVPVVSTLTGGIPELLRDGAGIMVPPKDPPALADAIERLIGNPDLRRQFVLAGRRRIEEEYSVEEVVLRLIRHIEELEPARPRVGSCGPPSPIPPRVSP